jgi:glycosyltransferase involved in cell wall biosynthesis
LNTEHRTFNFEPRTSVIICVYTEERLLDIKEAVNSVTDQTRIPDEIVVSVDHNPSLAEILHRELPPSVKIVRNDGIRGLSETRNVGILASSGDIVAFIDDDAVAEKDWLEYLIAPFKDEKVVAVGGKAVPLWLNGSRPSWFPEELDWIVGCTYKGLPVKDGQIRNVPGCNMAFRRNVFDKAGFWHLGIGSIGQKLKGGEEAELCLRIKTRISPALIMWQPESIIRHKVPVSRARLRWVWKNSYDQGVCKNKLNKLSTGSGNKTLNTENHYLYYLIKKSIPERLACFYRNGQLTQSSAILICVTATGLGYLVRKLKAS